jgi:hypothetical protein
MKKFIGILLFILIISNYVFGQIYSQSRTYGIWGNRYIFDSSFHFPFLPTLNVLDYVQRTGAMEVYSSDSSLRMSLDGLTYGLKILDTRDTSKFLATHNFVTQSNYFTGGTISSLPTVGQTINSTSIIDWINKAFYSAQPPTFSLSISGGDTLEMANPGNIVSITLNWTAGRQAKTNTLSSIVVNNINQSFTQPSAPGTTSGTQSANVTANTNQTFSGIVTTSDNQTASANQTLVWSSHRYWGYVNSSNPTDAQVITSAGGGSDFPNVKSKPSFNIVITGTNQNFYFAYPSSYGNLTSLVVGGFESLGAFTLTTRTLTNASGSSVSYNIYVSNNTFSNTTITGIITN